MDRLPIETLKDVGFWLHSRKKKREKIAILIPQISELKILDRRTDTADKRMHANTWTKRSHSAPREYGCAKAHERTTLIPSAKWPVVSWTCMDLQPSRGSGLKSFDKKQLRKISRRKIEEGWE